MEALKRTRISCAPGELRMKNDFAALERSELARVGRVRAASLGSNALCLSVDEDRYLVTVSQRYPFDPPTVRHIQTSEEPALTILNEWSAVFSLVDVANALFEKAQVRDLFRFGLPKKILLHNPPPVNHNYYAHDDDDDDVSLTTRPSYNGVVPIVRLDESDDNIIMATEDNNIPPLNAVLDLGDPPPINNHHNNMVL